MQLCWARAGPRHNPYLQPLKWCTARLYNRVCYPHLQVAPVLEGMQKEHKQEHGRLVSVTAAPEKARRQADLATADLSAAHQLLAAAETKHLEVEANLRGVSEHLRQRQVRLKAVLFKPPSNARGHKHTLCDAVHGHWAVLHLYLVHGLVHHCGGCIGQADMCICACRVHAEVPIRAML